MYSQREHRMFRYSASIASLSSILYAQRIDLNLEPWYVGLRQPIAGIASKTESCLRHE